MYYNETQASKRGDSQGQSGKHDEIMICTSFLNQFFLGLSWWQASSPGVLLSKGFSPHGMRVHEHAVCLQTGHRKNSPCIINHALRFELSACYVALRCTQENHVNVNAKNLTFHDPFHIPSILRPRLCRDSTGENLATYFDHGRRPLW